ncbi:hypothetical protein ACRJ4W_29950 [Streptomyces sp. GLT-R25]
MDIEEIRRETPGTANRVHLNNAGAALLSRRTLRTMTAHLELEAAIGGYEAADRERARIDATYANIARLVGGRPDEVALFDNSTHAWNAAFYSMNVRSGRPHPHRPGGVRQQRPRLSADRPAHRRRGRRRSQ